jgi:hypothetical protein
MVRSMYTTWAQYSRVRKIRRQLNPCELEPAAVYDTNGTRLTCLTLAEDAGGSAPVGLGKRKRSPRNGDRRNESDESDERTRTRAIRMRVRKEAMKRTGVEEGGRGRKKKLRWINPCPSTAPAPIQPSFQPIWTLAWCGTADGGLLLS